MDGSDETYDISGKWLDVRNNIPENIDLEFGITENMKEWAMQELADEIEQLEGFLSEDKDNHETIAQLRYGRVRSPSQEPYE